MSSPLPLDAAGRRRSPATMPRYLAGRPPRNKGLEMAHEGVALNIIQRQSATRTSAPPRSNLQGIDNAEIINAVHTRRAPVMPASAGLRL